MSGGAPPRNAAAALWLVLGAAAVTAMFAFAKLLEGRYGAFQITFIRGACGALLLTPPIIWRIGLSALKTSRPVLILWRSIVGTLTMVFGYMALPRLPLADVQAISFASILFMVPLAALILGERIGVRRTGAALIGFVGVLIMLRPSGQINLGALAALASALCFALTIISLRLISRHMTSEAAYVWGIWLMAALSAPFAFFMWRAPDLQDWGLLLAIAGAGALSQYCYVRAYSLGEATAISPTEYVKLVFAAAVGFWAFGETIDAWTAVGAAIIVSTSLYIWRRETLLARSGHLQASAARSSAADTPSKEIS